MEFLRFLLGINCMMQLHDATARAEAWHTLCQSLPIFKRLKYLLRTQLLVNIHRLVFHTFGPAEGLPA